LNAILMVTTLPAFRSDVPVLVAAVIEDTVGSVDVMEVASRVNSDTTKFPLGYCPPGPSPGSEEFLSALRKMPVIGVDELTNAVTVYVSVPIEFWLVLANNSPGDGEVNVVPLSEEAL